MEEASLVPLFLVYSSLMEHDSSILGADENEKVITSSILRFEWLCPHVVANLKSAMRPACVPIPFAFQLFNGCLKSDGNRRHPRLLTTLASLSYTSPLLH
jgi:hypothetical protein